MTQPASNVLQIPVGHLGSAYSSLAAALSDAGLSGNEMNEIFSKHVRGECIQCGIQVTGEDIGHMVATEATPGASNPKQDRLRQGYCARNGCESRYYNIHFTDYPNVDWAKIREKAGVLATAAAAEIDEETAAKTRAARKRRLIRLGVGAAAILILLLCRHILYYGYVPFLQKPRKFTNDPASMNRGPAR